MQSKLPCAIHHTGACGLLIPPNPAAVVKHSGWRGEQALELLQLTGHLEDLQRDECLDVLFAVGLVRALFTGWAPHAPCCAGPSVRNIHR